MIPDKAYSLAMSAGYIPVPRKTTGGYDNVPIKAEPQWHIDCLNAGFWQALEKVIPMNTTWRGIAGEFVDLILTGQPTDTFWAELLDK